jgi:hypothetical protein
MINFLYQLTGYRDRSPNAMDDKVTLYEFSHPIYNPSSHLGLLVEKGGQPYYFSFSPKDARGLKEIPFGMLREGREGFVLSDFEEETLLWGFRHAWNDDFPAQLKDNQIEKFLNYFDENRQTVGEPSDFIRKNFKYLSDCQLLEIAKLFPDATKSTLKSHGQPDGMTVLKTLDLDAMIAKMKHFEDKPPTWAPWASTYLHKENTYNCGSIILDILYTGKMGRLVTSSATQWSMVGALLGLLSLIKTDEAALVCAAIGIGFAGGRVAGGAYDGCKNVQYFFNMNANTENDKTSIVVGLRILSIFFGAILGPLKTGPFFPAFLTLPKNVMSLATEAKAAEDSCYGLNKEPHKKTGALLR